MDNYTLKGAKSVEGCFAVKCAPRLPARTEGLRREVMFGRMSFGTPQRGGAMLRVAVGLLACLIAFGACAVTGGGSGGSTTADGKATVTPKSCPTKATTTALTYV